ncbi:MAG: MFS transporter [Dysgonamonadaceae bacterium]|jgi:FHS family L-fucose permease-like MFS transporter|nr:MFS transporter [Dysgonamonadaceae bacterium]
MVQEKQKGNGVAILMMILLFGMISFVTNLAAPMGNILKPQFEGDNFLGMLGNAANFIAYAVMGIPSGILLQKYGYKKTALIAIAIGFIGVGIQLLSGFTAGKSALVVYLSGAFVSGFSMCLLNCVVNPMLNTLGGGGNKGNQLIQIGGSFNSVMATLTPMLVGVLIGQVTKDTMIKDVFPVMYIAMSIFAIAFIVLAFVAIPEPHLEKQSEPLGALMSGALKFRHFVLGSIAIFVYVGVEVGTPGMMNLWFSDNATGLGSTVGVVTAGFVVGMYWLLMLVGRLIGASIGSIVSSKTMLSVTSIAGLILVAFAIFSDPVHTVSLPVLKATAGSVSFGLAQVPINALYLVLVGLCTSIMWGGIYNLAVEGLGKYLAAASGIFMVLVCGGGLIPALQSKIADMIGYQTSYWVIFAGLAYLAFYALIGSKNVNKDIKVD